MRISVATEGFDDWSGLLALLRQAYASMDGRIDPPSSLDGMTAEDLRAKAAHETLILAVGEPGLLGCAFAALRPDCVYIGKLAVASAARGQGIARAMILEIERLARLQNRPFLELQTRIELTENHKTFAALGFEKVAETAHHGYSRPTSITMRRPVR